jgi:Adenomatosis polyposis coli down-regulated 1
MMNKNVLMVLAGVTVSVALAGELRGGTLVGRWESSKLENLGQLYGSRNFVLTERAWALQFKAFADEAGKTPLFSLRAEGTYTLGQSSVSVLGATEANFRFTKRYVTAESEAGVGLFQSMGCSLKLGAETNVSTSGCGFIPSVKAASLEYDLVQLDGNNLYFGDRSGDLTKTRPNKLNPEPVTRR